MAVLQRVALYPNERYDTPDARAMEAFAQNDWRFFLSGIISYKSYVLSGFEISNYTNIFRVPGIRLRQNNVAIMHPEATTQAAGFYVSAGSEADAELQLSPNATNFVEVDFDSTSGTPDTRAFWDMGADGGKGAEFTDEVDTVINLELKITTNASGFSEGKIPLYKIVTNNSGVAEEVTDCRPLFFRLGTGGSTPDPDYKFSWPQNSPDAAHSQFETAIKSTGATDSNAPFQGGDKNLKSLKEWMDAIMTSLTKIKGSSYWYTPSVSIPEAYQNGNMTIMVGGTWRHDPTEVQVGEITQTIPGYFTLTSGSTLYRLGKQNNCSLPPFASLDMRQNTTLFIILPDDSPLTYRMGRNNSTPVIPKIVVSASPLQIIVSGNGNYITGDPDPTGNPIGYLMIRNQKFGYKSAVYDQVNDVTTFSVITPEPSGFVKAGDYAYQAENTVSGYYHYGKPSEVPGMSGSVSEGAEKTKWLTFFDGSRFHTQDADLEKGEQVQIGQNTSDAILNYVGSTGESDSSPVYNVGSISNGISLTSAIKEAFKIIETPIYDETIIDTDGNGWPLGHVFTLPINHRSTPIKATVGSIGANRVTVTSSGKFIDPETGLSATFQTQGLTFTYTSYDAVTKTFTGVTPNPIIPIGGVAPISAGDEIEQNNSLGRYTTGSGELQVYENGVLWRVIDGADGDYYELSNNTIKINRDIPPGSYVRFRIASVGGAGAAAGGGVTGTTLQNAYTNGRTIVVRPQRAIEITGSGTGEIPLKIHGSTQIDNNLIASGLQPTPVLLNPFSTGSVGIWVDSDTQRLQYTRPDGTILKVGDILETVGGSNSQMARLMINGSSATIPAGSPVYITSPGQVALAHCDSDVAHVFLGIAAAPIAAGQQGKIIYAGVVPGIFQGMGLNSGYIWLGSTPGQLSLVEPQNVGDYLVIIGLIDGDDLILQPQMNGQL